MTDAPDLSAEAVEKLARNVICAPMWHSSIAAATIRALFAENTRLRAEMAATERTGRLKERISVADWAENTAFDGYLDGDSAERIAKMIRTLPLPPSTIEGE